MSKWVVLDITPNNKGMYWVFAERYLAELPQTKSALVHKSKIIRLVNGEPLSKVIPDMAS